MVYERAISSKISRLKQTEKVLLKVRALIFHAIIAVFQGLWHRKFKGSPEYLDQPESKSEVEIFFLGLSSYGLNVLQNESF
jgi:hypothetical protein